MINEDAIITARPATVQQKQTYPSASTNINTWVQSNQLDANQGTPFSYLISEQIGTLIASSN